MNSKLLKSLPPLLARATLATSFLVTGARKFKHLSEEAAYFKDLGVPAPKAATPLVAGVEVACGSLLLLGLFTRISALPLMPVMAVAIGTARRKDFHSFSELTGIYEFGYLLLLSYLLADGPGEFSADELLERVRHRRPPVSLLH